MEQTLLAIISLLVTALTGERVYSGVRTRRHRNPGLATKDDIKALRGDIAAMNKTVASIHVVLERHLGYHEGVRQG